ncbi:MAG: hypothetical protein M1511_06890, partial [Deltaproteobacteria bacterium]|nr:hypothetical protein [Deltaproteobacteria bacterium]
MPQKKDSHKADPEAVLEFLRSIRPFGDLEENVLERISRRVSVDFFEKDTVILEQNVSQLPYLFLIFRGAVKISLVASEAGACVLRPLETTLVRRSLSVMIPTKSPFSSITSTDPTPI